MHRLVIVVSCFLIGAAYAKDVEPPSMEFLEFIGEWESPDGQWQDPMQFKDMDQAELQHAQAGTTPVSDKKDKEVNGHEN